MTISNHVTTAGGFVVATGLTVALSAFNIPLAIPPHALLALRTLAPALCGLLAKAGFDLAAYGVRSVVKGRKQKPVVVQVPAEDVETVRAEVQRLTDLLAKSEADSKEKIALRVLVQSLQAQLAPTQVEQFEVEPAVTTPTILVANAYKNVAKHVKVLGDEAFAEELKQTGWLFHFDAVGLRGRDTVDIAKWQLAVAIGEAKTLEALKPLKVRYQAEFPKPFDPSAVIRRLAVTQDNLQSLITVKAPRLGGYLQLMIDEVNSGGDFEAMDELATSVLIAAAKGNYNEIDELIERATNQEA